jgi:ribosomal protein S18 acetylase RimI-like enzyme
MGDFPHVSFYKNDTVFIRAATAEDVPELAAIRAEESWDVAFWSERIGGYIAGVYHPREALSLRTVLVASDAGNIDGFCAGHATTRWSCDGEVQWVNVRSSMRGRGVARLLLLALLSWFRSQSTERICVNVAADNAAAIRLYTRTGALPLREGWMIWEFASQVPGVERS